MQRLSNKFTRKFEMQEVYLHFSAFQIKGIKTRRMKIYVVSELREGQSPLSPWMLKGYNKKNAVNNFTPQI